MTGDTDSQMDAELDQIIEMARAFIAKYPEEAIDGLQEAMEELSKSGDDAERLVACFTNVGIAILMQAQRRFLKSQI